MITAHTRTDHGCHQQEVHAGSPLPPGTVWLDIDRCSESEISALSQTLHLKLPALREVRHTHQNEQYYSGGKAIYTVTPMIVGAQTGTPQGGVMMMILTPELLITLRKAESRAIQYFAENLHKHPEKLHSPQEAQLGLIAALFDRLADLNETISHEMEQVSSLVFQESLQRSKAPGQGKPNSWRKVLQGLGRSARLNHRIISMLGGLDRVLLFLVQNPTGIFNPEQLAQIRVLEGEAKSLKDHASVLVEESNFLLDAIVGAISIEQNNVIKIFSMVSVILMPPTMIASIYGMNFVHMPELKEAWAYPAVLLLMLASAILPWRWFKRSGWF